MTTLASEAPEAVRIARWIEHDEVQRLQDQGHSSSTCWTYL